MRTHDLLQISGLADLVYVGWDLPEKRCPLWVEGSLERAPFKAGLSEVRCSVL